MVTKEFPTGVVKLCGRSGCCPCIDFTNQNIVVLTDDFGGKVTLTRDQWSELLGKFS